jgi:hypothetical protein
MIQGHSARECDATQNEATAGQKAIRNMVNSPFGKGLLLDGNPSLLFGKRHPRQACIMRGLEGSKSISRSAGTSPEPRRLV